MLFFFMAAFAAEPECRQINLAQDDAHAVERRGWVDGKPPVAETFDAGPLFGVIQVDPPLHAPDVAAVDRATMLRTKEYSSLNLGTGPMSRDCIDFGDIRAFRWAYANANLSTPLFIVTVNGKILIDEYGASMFYTWATDFEVRGLKPGDTVEILIVTEGFITPPTCHDVPTMHTETACTSGYMLWERRSYVY